MPTITNYLIVVVIYFSVDLERNVAINPFPQNTNRQADNTREWTTWWGLIHGGYEKFLVHCFLENSSAKNWTYFEVVNLSGQFWRWITQLVIFGSG